MTVAAHSYAVIAKGIQSIGLWSFILLRADLYRKNFESIVEALDKGQNLMKNSFREDIPPC